MSTSYNSKTGYYDIQFEYRVGKKRCHILRRSVSKSKKEAKKFEAQLRDELEGKKKSLNLQVLYDMRKEHLMKSGSSEGTYRTYEDLFKNHVLPFLQIKEISKYSESDIYEFINVLHDNGRSNNTINQVTSLLKALFNYAKKNHYLIGFSPLDNVEKLKVIKIKKGNYVTYQQFQQLLKGCREIEDDVVLWSCVWTILFELGLRKSEIEVLKVKDINFEHNTININRHIVEGHGEIVIKEGRKNGDGYDAPMSDNLKELLEQRIKAIEKYDGYSDDAYLFNVQGIYKPMARTTLQRHLDWTCERAGIERFNVHQLRHSCCMNLVEMGADVFTIANHIGDSVEMIQKVYGGRIKSKNYVRYLLNQQNKNKKN